MAASPARRAACALARTSASVSTWSARRSEWPTMTALAPASASISAETSPVCAPEGAGWQSCAPMARAEPRARSAHLERSVAGGQTIASAGAPDRPAARRSISPSAGASPFIFQLPAINCRILFVPSGGRRTRRDGGQDRPGLQGTAAWQRAAAVL
jgi:hypothetical protein